MFDILSDVLGGCGSVTPPPTEGFLLLESGDSFLLEDGSFILLEG